MFCIPLEKVFLTRPDKPDKQYGGFVHMSVNTPKIRGLQDLLENGLKLAQIYEICVPEGEYKDHLIANIPRGFERYITICDREFVNLEVLVSYLGSLPKPIDLVILNVSEILYLDFIKDYGVLQKSMQEFYGHLHRLANLGTTCIVFANYFYYNQIFPDIISSDIIQIQIRESGILEYWEAIIVNPPELSGRRTLFKPFESDVPFLIQF